MENFWETSINKHDIKYGMFWFDFDQLFFDVLHNLSVSINISLVGSIIEYQK